MYKRSQIFDGLMRAPLLYAWGNHLTAGRVSAMVEEVDIYPTVLSLAGIAPNPGGTGPGQDGSSAGGVIGRPRSSALRARPPHPEASRCVPASGNSSITRTFKSVCCLI